MFERRHHKRTELAHHLVIFSHDAQTPFGQLLNLTPGGMMIRTEAHVTARKAYKLLIKLPRKWRNARQIHFEAKCIWCKRDDTDEQGYRSGFQLTNLKDKDFESILALLHNFVRVY